MLKNYLIICLLFGSTLNVEACDLGVRGGSFEIKEEGFIAMMMRKLNEIDFEEAEKKMQALARKRIAEPMSVEGVKPAIKDREFWHDPTFVLINEIALPDGKVLYPAGTAINPLDHMNLERRLFFIDGRERTQIEWLKEQLEIERSKNELEAYDGVNKVILIAGSVLILQEEIKEAVYFDQSGEITTKWGITGSPAIAEQDGRVIKIKEVSLGK